MMAHKNFYIFVVLLSNIYFVSSLAMDQQTQTTPPPTIYMLQQHNKYNRNMRDLVTFTSTGAVISELGNCGINTGLDPWILGAGTKRFADVVFNNTNPSYHIKVGILSRFCSIGFSLLGYSNVASCCDSITLIALWDLLTLCCDKANNDI